MDGIDFRKYYHDEEYLLGEVGPRFRETGELSAADFVMILVWKANRAVGYHVKRLKRIGGCSFDEAVSMVAGKLHGCTERKNKLDLLIKQWEFALPTATAILAILYPEEFTVYDVVVYEELNHGVITLTQGNDSFIIVSSGS